MQDNWKDQVNKCLTLYVQYLLICINKHEHSYSQMIINTCMRFIIFLSFEQQIMSLMTNSNESIMIFLYFCIQIKYCSYLWKRSHFFLQFLLRPFHILWAAYILSFCTNLMICISIVTLSGYFFVFKKIFGRECGKWYFYGNYFSNLEFKLKRISEQYNIVFIWGVHKLVTYGFERSGSILWWIPE